MGTDNLHLPFFEPDPEIKILFVKDEAAEKSNVDFEIGVNATVAI